VDLNHRIVHPIIGHVDRITDLDPGLGLMGSILTCVSETQRDEKKGRANMIYVPGTVRLFQQHLCEGVVVERQPNGEARLMQA